MSASKASIGRNKNRSRVYLNAAYEKPKLKCGIRVVSEATYAGTSEVEERTIMKKLGRSTSAHKQIGNREFRPSGRADVETASSRSSGRTNIGTQSARSSGDLARRRLKA